ncbi:MAG: hypothetical protein UHD09_00920 [Bifidobacterium sp.]|nr:hypothetical protein [Bifidobacterium sp.]
MSLIDGTRGLLDDDTVMPSATQARNFQDRKAELTEAMDAVRASVRGESTAAWDRMKAQEEQARQQLAQQEDHQA